jgi:hypothetical protein
MSQEKYIGRDVHQATISVAVMDGQGKLILTAGFIPAAPAKTKKPPTRAAFRITKFAYGITPAGGWGIAPCVVAAAASFKIL